MQKAAAMDVIAPCFAGEAALLFYQGTAASAAFAATAPLAGMEPGQAGSAVKLVFEDVQSSRSYKSPPFRRHIPLVTQSASFCRSNNNRLCKGLPNACKGRCATTTKELAQLLLNFKTTTPATLRLSIDAASSRLVFQFFLAKFARALLFSTLLSRQDPSYPVKSTPIFKNLFFLFDLLCAILEKIAEVTQWARANKQGSAFIRLSATILTVTVMRRRSVKSVWAWISNPPPRPLDTSSSLQKRDASNSIPGKSGRFRCPSAAGRRCASPLLDE